MCSAVSTFHQNAKCILHLFVRGEPLSYHWNVSEVDTELRTEGIEAVLTANIGLHTTGIAIGIGSKAGGDGSDKFTANLLS